MLRLLLFSSGQLCYICHQIELMHSLPDYCKYVSENQGVNFNCKPDERKVTFSLFRSVYELEVNALTSASSDYIHRVVSRIFGRTLVAQ